MHLPVIVPLFLRIHDANPSSSREDVLTNLKVFLFFIFDNWSPQQKVFLFFFSHRFSFLSSGDKSEALKSLFQPFFLGFHRLFTRSCRPDGSPQPAQGFHSFVASFLLSWLSRGSLLPPQPSLRSALGPLPSSAKTTFRKFFATVSL